MGSGSVEQLSVPGPVVGTAGNTVTQTSGTQEEHQDFEEAKAGLVTETRGKRCCCEGYRVDTWTSAILRSPGSSGSIYLAGPIELEPWKEPKATQSPLHRPICAGTTTHVSFPSQLRDAGPG